MVSLCGQLENVLGLGGRNNTRIYVALYGELNEVKITVSGRLPILQTFLGCRVEIYEQRGEDRKRMRPVFLALE